MHLHIPSNSSVTTPLIPSPSLFLYSFPISASRIVIATHMETCCKCLNSPYSVRGVIYYKSEVRVCCFFHLRQQLLLLLLKASEEIPQEVAMILGEGLSFQQIQREVFILTCGKSKKGAELQAWGEREQARQTETSCTVVQSTEGRLEGAFLRAPCVRAEAVHQPLDTYSSDQYDASLSSSRP